MGYSDEATVIPFRQLRLLDDRYDKAKIAVDVDSILYSFEDAARQTFLDLYQETENDDYLKGAYVAWTEWRSPADVCGVDVWMDVIERCHSPEVILAQTPLEGSVETLNELHDAGYRLMYISARNENAAEATHQWLTERGFPIHDGTEVICQLESKQPFMAECQYIIDDRPRTLIDFVYDKKWQGEQRKGFSLAYPYNQALTDIKNIYLAPTWNGMRMYMKRKGLL